MADFERQSRWQLRPDEKKQFVMAAAQIMSSFAGPLGPLIPLVISYAYERRDIIFGRNGVPVRAINLEGDILQLSGRRPVNAERLSARAFPSRQVVSFSPTLTRSARAAGLREGDPVSVVLASSRNSRATRSGLIIPTQVGSRVDLVVPKDEYTVGALGSGVRDLFSKRDPFAVIGGGSLPSGATEMELSLTARNNIVAEPLSPQYCFWCNRLAPAGHVFWCPKRLFRTGMVLEPSSSPGLNRRRIFDLGAAGGVGNAPKTTSSPSTLRQVATPKPGLNRRPIIGPGTAGGVGNAPKTTSSPSTLRQVATPNLAIPSKKKKKKKKKKKNK
jgi:hypothetical protein